MKSSIYSEIPFCNVMLAFALLSLAPLRAPAQTQCVDTNVPKYLQPPNPTGFDVLNSGPWVLADDFVCTNSGPITDIHIWGSWLNDNHGTITNFWLGIYDDVPVSANNPNSHPGNLLWSESFPTGQFAESSVGPSQEQFLDPGPGASIGTDTQIWYYCFFPTNPFVQTGTNTAPKTYWLAAYAQVSAVAGANPQYGWKTTFSVQHDTSVHEPWAGSLPGTNSNWLPTAYQPPAGGQVPLDLAFMLTTPTSAPPVEIDFFPSSSGQITLQFPDLHTETVMLNGSTTWHVNIAPNGATSDSSNGLDYVTSEIVQMDLMGNSSMGPVHVTLNPSFQSLGQIVEQVNNTPGILDVPPFTATGLANSFFDIFFEITIGTQTFLPATSIDLQGVISHKPPGPGQTYTNLQKNPLLDTNGNPTGINLINEQYTPNGNECCPDNGGVKWVQRPDVISGIDYNATQLFILADDFKCTNSGPITDIHLWGSWLSDQVDLGATYTLAIWSDAPTNVDRPFSHPGNLLWSQVFAPGNYTICPYTNAAEAFYNPGGAAAQGSSTNLYYLCFFPDPASAFRQGGSPNVPTNYWLSVTVQSSYPAGPIFFGWKSSFDHYNDTAVQTTAAFPPPTGAWNPFYNPTNGSHVDLAFKITTATNNPPPVVCVESDFEKYVQGPNIIGGLDVWNTPYVLADDFVCTNTGPISDIHLWGSWLNDSAKTNSITFWLGIYDDVPVGSGNTFSHPGTNLLWQQWFSPGQYAEEIVNPNASEQFLDPGLTNILGPDFVVWYYCFYPTNAFQQTGTPTNSKTYWLAAYAQLPAGTTNNYGWKTTTNVLKDTSVHAFWPGSAPTNNPGWTPTVYQPPVGGPVVPLDLAFKVTMCGPVAIHWLAPTNVVLTWPGAAHLQWATNVQGPYIDVPLNPPSPFTDYSVTPTNKFYRLRCY